MSCVRRGLWLAAVLLSACAAPAPTAVAGPAASSVASDAASGDQAAAPWPTFHAHVAPIYAQRCNPCHVAGGIAPFELTSFASAKAHGPASKAATQARIMPPWAVLADGSCGQFRDTRWLSDAELNTIATWVDAGMPAGNPAAQPAAPPPPAALEGKVVDYQMAEAFAPMPDSAGGQDDHRCFLIDPKLDKDQFVTGFDVQPGNPQVVHHVLVFSVNPLAFPVQAPAFGSNENVMADLKKSNPDRPGWPCYAAAGEGVLVNALPATWAPGTPVVRYPAGTGLRLSKGDVLVMQVHYNLGNVKGKAVDQSKVRLQLADAVEREGFVVLHDPFLFSSLGNKPQSIAPGQAKAKVQWQAKRGDLGFFLPNALGSDFDIYAIYPHMHKRGRTASLRVEHPQKAEECAMQVDNWNFNWQQFYWYDKPIAYDAQTVLHFTCTFDTTQETQPVMPGYATQNEMCLAGLYFVKK